jgi:hypothetical protein
MTNRFKGHKYGSFYKDNAITVYAFTSDYLDLSKNVNLSLVYLGETIMEFDGDVAVYKAPASDEGYLIFKNGEPFGLELNKAVGKKWVKENVGFNPADVQSIGEIAIEWKKEPWLLHAFYEDDNQGRFPF